MAAAAARGAAAAAIRGLGPGAQPAARRERWSADLEEIIRRGQDQLKNVVPGGFNGGIFVIVGLLILGFVLLNSIYTVQPDERGVEMRFGKPKEKSPCRACTITSGRSKPSRSSR